MHERFQPPKHTAPDTFIHSVVFYARLFLDFQLNTVYRHMKKFLARQGGVIVDVGAGECPFKHLVKEQSAQYRAFDIYDAANFGYKNPSVTFFDGKHIPLEDGSADAVICTEVLEHVEEPALFIQEISRVLKSGGNAAFTVPWSARFHYIPYDYHRFTPTRLKTLFSSFSSAMIEPRGTDITVIVSKCVVVFARLVTPVRKAAWVLTLPLAILLAPFLGIAILIGHATLILKLGSTDDPLGYTVWLSK